ncbi:MAG: hypothetical protein CL477_01600 [Acidobacteria bacterium]|jgi:hypothetical protein|nr:hypothetical protein [Acidobacteriota bacterium]MDP7479187.1 hypothetical protein [Vicinamibacterales bacterium]MDP7691013.1 hypothetical protein [Vicinamibacterales bacterium]HJN46290.1 hypothetical protein [Vicinamibacterales bacterium]
MAVPPTPRARTGAVPVPRVLLVVGSAVLLTALLAVAYLLGREVGRTEQVATSVGTEAAPAPVEPTAPPRGTATRHRPARSPATAPLGARPVNATHPAVPRYTTVSRSGGGTGSARRAGGRCT